MSCQTLSAVFPKHPSHLLTNSLAQLWPAVFTVAVHAVSCTEDLLVTFLTISPLFFFFKYTDRDNPVKLLIHLQPV